MTLNLDFKVTGFINETRSINAFDVSCAQLTRDLFAIAKFLYVSVTAAQKYRMTKKCGHFLTAHIFKRFYNEDSVLQREDGRASESSWQVQPRCPLLLYSLAPAPSRVNQLNSTVYIM